MPLNTFMEQKEVQNVYPTLRITDSDVKSYDRLESQELFSYTSQ
jgi:hypothetical protein